MSRLADLHLKVLCGEVHLDGHITHPRVQKPGLAFAGYFDYIKPGEDLVAEPFDRLIAERRLCTLRYEGFWSCMDTFKEMQDLEDIYTQGNPPWEIWRSTTPGGETS